jgi:hypothetical protein
VATEAPKLRTVTDETHGYEFGCDGLMGREEVCKFIAGVSVDTLEDLCDRGEIRKGKIPGGRKAFFCRRSVREFVRRMEL